MKIKKTLFNFRIFLIGLFLFTFSLPSVYSNQENPSGEELKKAKEIILSEIPLTNLKEGQENILIDGYVSKLLHNIPRSLIYTYQNQKGEVIFFLRDGKYCNLNKNTCKNISGFSLDFVNVYDHRGYIVFFGSTSASNEGTPSVHIFNKKTENFFNLDLRFYVKTTQPYTSNYDISYIENKVYTSNNFSFEIGKGMLRLYLLYPGSGETLPDGKTVNYPPVAQVVQIAFDKLKDEMFDPSRVYSYIYQGSYFDNYMENVKTKYGTNNIQLLMLLGRELLSSFARKYNSREDKNSGEYSLYYRESSYQVFQFRNYNKAEFTDYGIKTGYNLVAKGTDMVETYINGRGVLADKGVAYIDDYSSFYTGRDGKLWQLWIERDGEEWHLVKKMFNGFLGFNFSLNNYKVLNVKQDQEGYFYLSYLENNNKLNTLVSKKLYRLNTENVDYKIIQDQYYLGNFNGIKLFISGKKILETGQFNYYFPMFYLSRSGNNYNFIKFLTQGYGYSAMDYLYKSNDRIFTEDNIKMYFGGNFNLSNKPIETDHEKLDNEGDTIEDLKNEEKLNKKKEEAMKKFDDYYGFIPGLKNFYSVISFSFPYDWHSRGKIPYLVTEEINGKIKVSYKTSNVNIEKVTDKLNISNIESDENGKKVISFFLTGLYLFLKILIFSFVFYYIYFLYIGVKWINDIFIPMSNKFSDSAGNFISGFMFVAFSFIFVGVCFAIFNITDFMLLFISNLVNILNLIFGFLQYNFFDFVLFKNILTLLDASILILCFTYAGYRFSLKFGRVN